VSPGRTEPGWSGPEGPDRAPQVWLIDAHYQIFRAYHSLPALEAPDGTPTGALRGYAAQIIRFLARQSPTHVVAAFDHDLTSFRNQLHPGYKHGRTEAPADLEPQFALCVEATRALGIAVCMAEGFEADDVIATLVRRFAAAGAQVFIVSADKDLGALVGERVSLLDLRSETAAGSKQVEERLGVVPERVADWLALAGDAVDNVPGVRGIGAKTAAALLRRWDGIDAIPRDAEALAARGIRGAARVARALAESADALALSRALVRLRDDLPLALELEGARWPGADRAHLAALFERLGVQNLLARVPRFRD
jgi:5'-3' exonuclease